MGVVDHFVCGETGKRDFWMVIKNDFNFEHRRLSVLCWRLKFKVQPILHNFWRMSNHSSTQYVNSLVFDASFSTNYPSNIGRWPEFVGL